MSLSPTPDHDPTRVHILYILSEDEEEETFVDLSKDSIRGDPLPTRQDS